MNRTAARRTPVLAALLAVAARGHAFELTGRAGRWSVGGYTEGYAVLAVNPGSQRQRPAGILDFMVTGDVHPRARLVLDARTTFGGPPERAHGFGVFNLSETFQNLSPGVDLDEAYVDLFLPGVDLRVGKQKFAWGRLDRFQPTDVLNPRRFTDPFVTEEQDAKIGVPALRAFLALPPLGPRLPSDLSVELAWIPVPMPTRFPLPGERWFPPAADVLGPQIIPPGHLCIAMPDGPICARKSPIDVPAVRVERRLHAENDRPPQQLVEGAVAVRSSGRYSSIDWSSYYYDGSETAPSLNLTATVFSPVARRRPARLACSGNLLDTLASLRNDGVIPLQADAVLRPRFGRIRLAGGDAAFQVGRFGFRMEAAYGVNRQLPRPTRDLIGLQELLGRSGISLGRLCRLARGRQTAAHLAELFVARDTVEWGVGIDYGYRGWVPVAQLNQTFVLRNATSLLVPDVETRLLFGIRRDFLADRVAAELAAVQEIERGYTTALGRATLAVSDHLRLRLGYLMIAGTRRSLIGQYHDNDEAFVQLRYSY